MKMWMFNCKEVSKLLSVSMDRELSWSQKMGVRFHLMMCKYCTRFHKQLRQMRGIIKSSFLRNEDVRLANTKKEEIKTILKSQGE